MRLMIRLLPYVWPHRRGLLVVLVTMAFTIAMSVLQPWPLKILLDQVIDHRPAPPRLAALQAALPAGQDLLLWVCVGTVLIFMARTFFAMVSAAESVTFSQSMVYDLGADVFLHLQRLSLVFHSRRPLGDTVARVTGDTYCVQLLVSSALIPLLQSVLTLVAMFAVMWQLEPTMTALSLGVAPFLMILIRLFGTPMKRRSRKRRDLEGKLMSVVEQTLSAIPAVQAFTREELEYDRFRAQARETVNAYRRSTIADMWFKFFIGLVTALGTAAIMWLGVRRGLSSGAIMVFLAYLGSLYEPLNSLVFTTSTLQYAAANADRVFEILDTRPDVIEAQGARDARLRGHVRYENVTFGYEPGRPVTRNVSLEARPGEVVAIVGPTGAGKTTLANLLARLVDPWSGRITIDGIDVRNLRLRGLRQQVALVLQEPFIFPFTVAENIAYGRPGAARDEIVAAAKAANAHDFIQRLAEGYDTVVGERGATLSGGEKQRLSIARAILKNAPILVLDEPTSALDARTESLLLDALERLMAGRTTFIIAHRLSTIRNADRILALDSGQIVEQGEHDALMARGGLYASLYRQQMELARHDSVTPFAAEEPLASP